MIRTVLLPLDHSAFAEYAILPAAAIARCLNARIDVVLVHEREGSSRRSAWDDKEQLEEQRYVQGIAERLSRHDLPECTHSVLSGDVVHAICEHAREVSGDLIVMTSHGQTGFNRTHLGSVAYGLVGRSTLPVLVLRNPEVAKPISATHPVFQKILVPLDGSSASFSALASAIELAGSAQATIVLMRVIEPVPMFATSLSKRSDAFGMNGARYSPPTIQNTNATDVLCADARVQLADLAQALTAESNVTIQSAVVVGSPVAGAIVDYASAIGADLIAMSTHGRGASRWALGSISDAVLRTSNFPLLLSPQANVRDPEPCACVAREDESAAALSFAS